MKQSSSSADVWISSIMQKLLEFTSWSEQIQLLGIDHVLFYYLAILSWAVWIE